MAAIRGLDQYITGGRYSRTTLSLACKNGHRWEAPGFEEYGGLFLDDDDDGVCEECGESAEDFE